MFGQVFGSSDRAWDDIVQGLHVSPWFQIQIRQAA